MNKKELIKEVGSRSKCTLNIAKEVIDATLDTIKEKVLTGEKVSIYGFGTFYQRYSAARSRANPKTGETVNVPEKLRFKFKAAKKLSLIGGE